VSAMNMPAAGDHPKLGTHNTQLGPSQKPAEMAWRRVRDPAHSTSVAMKGGRPDPVRSVPPPADSGR